MKILVTGGAGFLGSHLIEKLLSENHEVICVDNFYTGSKLNIRDYLHNDNFELIRHDINVPLFIEVDGVFNLACPASPVHYQKNPVQTIRTNVIGTTNMLGLAKRLQIPFFQASTSEIYGDPTISPQDENYWGNTNPIGIRACYDEGKRAAETIASDYARQYGVDVKIARIFNTYGPRMAVNDGRVVSNFIVQALENRPITIYGNGEQTRSFCFVSDLIDGFLKLFFINSNIGPINLGNPEPITMNQLAHEVIALTNSKSIIKYENLPLDDPQKREPNISKAKELLGWEPSVSRTEGLKQTISYFRKILQK